MPHIVVMGVSGAGKSTLARALADKLTWPFLEGDDLHPAANVDKMRAGIALNDDDRAPWLAAIHAWIENNHARGNAGVVTCSALKRAYRDAIQSGANQRDTGDVHFVYLAGDRAVLEAHLAQRRDHFMPATLLSSQLATLDPPTAREAVIIDAALPTAAQVRLVLSALGIES